MTKQQTGLDLCQILANRPLAMAPRAVDAVMSAPRAMFGGDIAPAQRDQGWDMTEGGIAVLPIFGPLLQRGEEFTRWLGIASYDDIGDAAEQSFANPTVRGVLLEIDSPGGEVAGLFDLVDYLASLKATYGKPLWAIAREQALSAAYAIASVADRIYTTQTGEVGSVGVLAVHVDRSAHDKMDGRKYSLIHAGAKKADGNPHIPLSPSAMDDIQADVDDLYARFVARVANNRRISPQAVTATEAAIYRGQHALDAGLADVVGTLETAHGDLLASLDAPLARASAPKPTPTTSQSSERTMTMTIPKKPLQAAAPAAPVTSAVPAIATPQAAPVADVATPVVTQAAAEPTTVAQPPAPTPAPDANAAIAASIRAEAAEIATIGAQATALGLSIDVGAALTSGTKPDALRQSILKSLAARGNASALMPVAPALADAAPKISPLVAAAEAVAKTA